MNNAFNERLLKLLSANCVKSINNNLEFLLIKYNRLVNTKNMIESNKPCLLLKKKYSVWKNKISNLELQINNTILDIEKCIEDIEEIKKI